MKATSEKLKARLTNFGLSDQQLETLAHGLNDATSVQAQIGNLYDKGGEGNGFKEFKDELTRLRKALVKLKSGKGTQQAALKTIAATTKALTDGWLYELSPSLPSAELPAERDFETVIALILIGANWYIDEALVAIDSSLNNIKTPGAGGARSQARKYIAGIKTLAYWFNEAAPSSKISASEDSIFYSYVKHWLEVETGREIEPKRHIGHMIEQKKLLL